MINMRKKFYTSVHVWEIKGLVNIDKKFKDTIKNQLLLKYGSYEKTSLIVGKATGVTISYFLRNKESFMRISNLFRLTNSLDISSNVVETHIIAYRDHNAQPSFYISFPYKFNPLVLRIIAHIPGDGNIRKDGMARWIQNDTKCMKILLKKLGFPIKPSKSKSVCIPRFLVKVNCLILGLQPGELNSSKLIKKVIKLPRQYKVQTILALIEDEATIDAKNYGTINIRLADKDLIKSYAKLCDSLDYKRSNIIGRSNTGFGKDGSIIYKIGILAEGIRSLNIDYNATVNKFGKIGGLWKKDTAFRKRCIKALSEKALKDNEGREITKKILKILDMHGNLSVKKICDLMNTDDYNRIYDRVKYLYKTAKIRRINRGKYALIKYL